MRNEPIDRIDLVDHASVDFTQRPVRIEFKPACSPEAKAEYLDWMCGWLFADMMRRDFNLPENMVRRFRYGMNKFMKENKYAERTN